MDEPRTFQPHTDTEAEKNVQKVKKKQTLFAISVNFYIIKMCIIMAVWLETMDQVSIVQPHTNTDGEEFSERFGEKEKCLMENVFQHSEINIPMA